MPDTEKNFLDLEGLKYYDGKIQAQLDDKVDVVAGKQLSTEDFTTAEKEKLSGLKNYTLPVSTEEELGGVKIKTSEDPVPTSTALKVDATGNAYVDWSEAPKASASNYGLMKLSGDFTVDEDTGSVTINPDKVGSGSVSWTDITDKPDVALKSDIAKAYQYKGSVANYASLPTEDLEEGDVYNVEDTGMNYAWTGTEWDALGGSFSISRITNEQIDALFETEG